MKLTRLEKNFLYSCMEKGVHLFDMDIDTEKDYRLKHRLIVKIVKCELEQDND